MQSLNHFTIPENHLSSIIVCTFILVQQTVLDVEKTHILCASVFVRGCVLSSKPTRKWVCHTTCIYVTDIININMLHSPENKLNTEYLKFSIPTINAFAVYLFVFQAPNVEINLLLLMKSILLGKRVFNHNITLCVFVHKQCNVSLKT